MICCARMPGIFPLLLVTCKNDISCVLAWVGAERPTLIAAVTAAVIFGRYKDCRQSAACSEQVAKAMASGAIMGDLHVAHDLAAPTVRRKYSAIRRSVVQSARRRRAPSQVTRRAH